MKKLKRLLLAAMTVALAFASMQAEHLVIIAANDTHSQMARRRMTPPSPSLAGSI